MTPLYQRFSKTMPARWATILLGLHYAAMLGAILFFEAPPADQIIYIDMQG